MSAGSAAADSKSRPTSSTLPRNSDHYHGPSASVDNTPAESVASSSSPSSPTTTFASVSNIPQVSSFAHPLDTPETQDTSSSNHSHHYQHRFGGHGHGTTSAAVPMTPGEEMVFDRGLLFASSHHRPSTQSDPSSSVSTAPLPPVPSIFRNSSDPEPLGLSTVMIDGNAAGPREIRTMPIYVPVIHRPSSPTTSSHRASMIQSRSPSPNPAITTQESIMANQSAFPLPVQHQQQQQALQHLSPVASSTSLSHSQHQIPSPVHNGPQRRPYTQNSTPAALRPDSVCSRSGSIKDAAAAAAAAKAASLAPVLTHHDILQTSDGITSREQLYDLLNKDDDDEDEHDRGTDTEHLKRPKPGFISSGRRSSKSSRRNSIASSSLGSHSGIELNAKGEHLLAASLPRPVQAAPIRGKDSGSRRGGSDRKELVSAAMVTSEKHGDSCNTSDTDFSNPTSSLYLGTKSEWLKSKSRTSRKWRGICCAVGLLAFLAAVAGIVLGFVTRKGKVDGLAPPPSPDNPPTVQPPITQFTPNPNLHKSFYGLDYNPAKSLMPWCGATLQNVIDDVILMSQLTNRIRLYGMDCSQADLTFQAISALKLNSTMKVVLTLWVDKNTTTTQRQYDTLFKVLDTYGTDMVQGISVGNEVLFRQDMNLTELASLMDTVRTNIKTRYGKSIPIFTSEIGNNLNSNLAAVSDELSGNLHPYFAGTAVTEAANWTIQQYNATILANPTKAGLKGAISEVGWPSAPASAVYQTYAVPGLANLQTMVDTFICEANRQGIPYYWFEFKDEPWKNDPTVPVEPNWGLFDKDGNLKINIPDCTAP
ncbi:hypothetical protein EDD11_010157 [Mortierella claussenii]|nr:hypothetical protein EDD11_010157 [Mortierella claussenii]